MISVKGTVAESLSGTRETNQSCDVDTKFVKIFYDSASSLVYDCSKKGSIRFSISTSRNTRFHENLLVLTRRHPEEHPRRGNPRAIRVYTTKEFYSARFDVKDVRTVEINYRVTSESWNHVF